MSATESPAIQRFLVRVGNSRFFWVALLLHLLFIMGFGGAVLFESEQDIPEFMAKGGSLVTESVSVEPPPEKLVCKSVQFSPPTPTMEKPSMSAITCVNPSASCITLPVSATAAFSATRIFHEQTGEQVTQAGPAGTKNGDGASHSFFGSTEPNTAALLAGTFYDLKQDKHGKSSDMNGNLYAKTITDFVTGGWNTSAFSKFFRSPKQIFTGQVFIPEIEASEGPKAFQTDNKVKPGLWVVHYKAMVSPPESGVYHFVGAGDDVLFVRFNNKLVLERCWNFKTDWKPVADYHYGYTGMPGGFAKGDGVTVQAGQFYPIEILIGEQPGGKFFASLLIEKEGAQYQKHSSGAPILPVFRVSTDAAASLQNGQRQPPYLENGPVWKAQKPGLGSALDFARKL